MRILVVDDDKFSLRALSQVLRNAGYDVVEAMQAEQVLSAAEDGKFAVAVMDIFMPGMGGIEAIQRIHAKSPECKIVAVSAGHPDMSSDDTIKAAIKIGADTGFTKPVATEKLLKQIKEWSDAGELKTD